MICSLPSSLFVRSRSAHKVRGCIKPETGMACRGLPSRSLLGLADARCCGSRTVLLLGFRGCEVKAALAAGNGALYSLASTRVGEGKFLCWSRWVGHPSRFWGSIGIGMVRSAGDDDECGDGTDLFGLQPITAVLLLNLGTEYWRRLFELAARIWRSSIVQRLT